MLVVKGPHEEESSMSEWASRCGVGDGVVVGESLNCFLTSNSRILHCWPWCMHTNEADLVHCLRLLSICLVWRTLAVLSFIIGREPESKSSLVTFETEKTPGLRPWGQTSPAFSLGGCPAFCLPCALCQRPSSKQKLYSCEVLWKQKEVHCYHYWFCFFVQ